MIPKERECTRGTIGRECTTPLRNILRDEMYSTVNQDMPALPFITVWWEIYYPLQGMNEALNEELETDD